MKKKQTLRAFYSSLIVTLILFSAIFFPIYYRTKRVSIEEYAILQINTIECTDKLQSGNYKLKISIVKRNSFSKYPIQIQGSQIESYGMNTTVSKKIRNSLELIDEGIIVFLKLRKGIKSETEFFQINNNNSQYIWSNEIWFSKFGGSIRINYLFLIMW
ncbi:MAG: hypothetical protein KGD59_13560 [Candidatus Heimdallarchaeota archaeon]|nr:hypothetical protein [Candidatus Heimdallarchaeota archaeon]MBY8995571.1 hypothetical protein [Candidatus Heimdallarchaeota archaeon]